MEAHVMVNIKVLIIDPEAVIEAEGIGNPLLPHQ